MGSIIQENPNDRKPVAAGRFYAADAGTLKNDIESLFRDCKKNPSEKPVRALICPHAGYVYSGKTAAAGISTIPRDKKYNNIFLIGSSHVMTFEGASVYPSGNYMTPLGKVRVNSEIASELIASHPVFRFNAESHTMEHSLEVQLPLIQYWFKDLPDIVPIIIGTISLSKIKEISEALKPYFTPDNLFIISSDLSHYPPYDQAVKLDDATIMSIISGSSAQFLKEINKDPGKADNLATRMCGWTSGLLLLNLTEEEGVYHYEKIDYTNSGDSKYGIQDEVVGYSSIRVTEMSGSVDSGNNFNLKFSSEEISQLFRIAKSAISSVLNEGKAPVKSEKDFSENLKGHYGAFVTLRESGSLRGCIGRFTSDEPLYKVVSASAFSSAFEDPRFAPVSKEEYPELEFEITVLGPLRKISSISEIILGRHGIYIRKDNRAGTLLPQVATENGWSVEEFLGYTSRDKAGIGWDGWKNAEIFIYDGLVLSDPDKKK